MAKAPQKKESLSEKVSLLLEETQWSYTVLAELLGVSKTAIHHYVTGQRGMSSAQVKRMELLLSPALKAKNILKGTSATSTKADKLALAELKRTFNAKKKILQRLEEWLARYEHYAREHKRMEMVASAQLAYLQKQKLGKKALATLSKSIKNNHSRQDLATLDMVLKKKAELAGLKQELKALEGFMTQLK